MKLGDNVKYMPDGSGGDEILATVQENRKNGDVVISVPGGVTIVIPSDEVSTKLATI